MPTKKPTGTVPIYQLKIALEGIEPPIWRRVLVPADATLAQLHAIIQIVMGWEDEHLHEFIVSRKHYSDPRFRLNDEDLFASEEDKSHSEARARLGDVAPSVRNTFRYQYDFGDSWMHKITVEKHLAAEPGQTYPLCIEGARACPPEDCGGVWGYEELLDVLADPEHPNYEERLEWVGGRFDPEGFDIKAVNRDLARYCARKPHPRRTPGTASAPEHDAAR
jgi:hypothetical protein